MSEEIVQESAAQEMTAHEIDLLRQYVEASRAIAQWNELRVKARDQLAASLGTNTGTIRDRTAVTVIRVHQRRFDTKTFQVDYPLLYQQYMRTSDNESITIKPREDVLR